MDFDGLTLTPPPGFDLADSQAVFRIQEPAASLSGPTLARSRGLSPNLIVQRRRLADPTSLEAYAERLRGELAALQQLAEVKTEPLAFTDEYPGLLVSYSFSAPSGMRVRQLQALRVDAGSIVTIGLVTVPDTREARDREPTYLRALSTICPTDTR
jgi:hypothetical protein